MRRLALSRVSSVALVSSALLAACGGGAGGAGAMGGFTPQVTVVTLKTQPVTLSRELPGRTSAYLVADVRPQVSGLVKKRLFTEGGLVKAGQPLYELDDAPYVAAYNSARATLRKAQATLEAAKLTQARDADLIKIDAVSRQDNENAIAAEGQAEADVAAGEAAVATAQVNLNYAHIVSPISGRIGKSAVTQGALVTADQATSMATVQTLDPIYVDVNQSSSEWLALQKEITGGHVQARAAEAPTKVVLEDGTPYAEAGKLQFSDVTVDPATGNFLLRVIVPNPKGLLMPGMYVRAVVDEGVLTQGLLAPQQGITRDPKGNATALVVGKDDKVEQRTVRVSRAVGDQWLVEDGLAAGDRVIVEGLQKVQPGIAVKAVEASAAQPEGGSAPAAASAGSAAAGQ